MVEYEKLIPDERQLETDTLRQAQLVMLRILRIVDDICRRNHITYWLHAGSLLGAVRHRGFIPWDDDIDIAMPRADYQRFVQLAKTELPEDLFLQTKETDKEYPSHLPPKIRDRKSRLIESFKEEEHEVSYCQGVFIDIFPFDSYPCSLFSVYGLRRRISDLRKRFPEESIERTLCNIMRNTIGQLLFLPLRLFEWALRKLKNRLLNNPNYPLLCKGLDHYDCIPYLREDILPLKETYFEGFSFFVPGNSAAYLRKRYGDYMVMPPENERSSHARRIVIDTGSIWQSQ